MKIIECYVKAFGNIKDKKYSFREGLNVIREDNGYGKSTLAAFIKAMLYGLGDTKRASLKENERKRYLPWSGERASGTLTLVSGKSQYRIERIFGKKASEDSFRLIDLRTGRQTEDYSDSFGTEIFGIDSDGFERTVFLSERSLDPASANNSVAAKLSDLASIDGDLGMLDEALEILDDQRKFYYKKGGGGEISTLGDAKRRDEALLEESENAIIRIAEQSERQRALQKRSEEIKAEEAEISRELEKLAKLSAKADRASEIADARERLNALRNRRDELFLAFNANIPSYEEVRMMESKAAEAKSVNESEARIKELEAQLSPLRKYLALQSDGEEINRVRRAVEELENEEKYRASSSLFARRIPLEEEIDKVDGQIKKAEKMRFAPLALPLMLLAVIFAALAYFVDVKFLSGVAAAVAVIAVYLPIAFLKRAKARRKVKESLIEFIFSISGKEIDFEGAKALLPTMKNEIKTAVKSKESYGIIHDFYAKFATRVEDNEKNAVKSLLGEADRAREISEKIRLIKESLSERQRDALSYAAEVDLFLRKYGAVEGGFAEIRERLDEYSSLMREIVRLCGIVEVGDFSLPSSDDSDKKRSEELRKRMRELISEAEDVGRKLSVIEKELERLGERANERDEIQNRTRGLSDKISEYRENLEAIRLAEKYLTLAKENINSKYLGSAKSAFVSYARMIEDCEREFDMSTEFAVSRLELGVAHPKESFSRAEAELYSLATRLALVDSLYPNESPFLLLDDPFAALDDKKCERALRLVKELSKSRQIIYLTPSSARVPIGT